jgi:hypothetical protein
MLPISRVEVSWLRTPLVVSIIFSKESDYFSVPHAISMSATPVYLGPEVTAYNANTFNVMTLALGLVNVKWNKILISWSL